MHGHQPVRPASSVEGRRRHPHLAANAAREADEARRERLTTDRIQALVERMKESGRRRVNLRR